MEVCRYENYLELSRAAADLIGEVIKKKPNALICIASGHTPGAMLHNLASDIQNKNLDASKATFVSLDEWLGIDPSDPGSCISMLRKDFFDHVSVRVETFDVNTDPEKECDRINHLIERSGGLDVMLVGIGLNGHIGMNEPGSSFNSYARVTDLAQETITTGQKYFQKPTKLSKGITLGLKHFAESKLPIIMANGSKKAGIIKKVVESPATEMLPASVIHKIAQAKVMIDADAASLLQSIPF